MWTIADGGALSTLLGIIRDYDALIGIGVSWAVAGWLYLRTRSNWKTKSFLEQINFSINDIRDGRLHLRTLYEASATDVLVNQAAVSQLRRATATTTVDKPFFTMPDDEDWGFVMRAMLNVLSELSADVFLAQALRRPVSTGQFVFGATFECYGAMNTRKVRVLLIEERLLAEYFGPDADPARAAALTFDSPQHADRRSTLQAMARLYYSDKPADKRHLRVVELGIAS